MGEQGESEGSFTLYFLSVEVEVKSGGGGRVGLEGKRREDQRIGKLWALLVWWIGEQS